VKDTGFTPKVREVDALVDLLADEDLSKHAERAIARVGPAALVTLKARLSRATPPLRGRIVKAIGRFAREPAAADVLLGLLEDPAVDPKSRRNAVIALGHGDDPRAVQALTGLWERDPRPEMRRSIAASLGKIAAPDSLALLRGAASSDDPELARIADRATRMVERTTTRGSDARLDPARSPGHSTEVILLARAGLEKLLAEELAGVAGVERVQVEGGGRVRALLTGALDQLFASRLWLDVRFPLAGGEGTDGETAADSIARAVSGTTARDLFDAWSVGPPRYRLEWVDAGHRRAATWDAVRAIARRAPGLVNDPTASTWEILVTTRFGAVDVALRPRGLDDPRFAWRKRDVPAASHPTVAAALARIAGASRDDVVWDPFVGSGGELVERSLLGPYRTLLGTDIDERAIDAARANLAAARAKATLTKADALGTTPPGVTLVITNPPMGRRSLRASGTADMLDRFVAHAGEALVPGGRLVWIAPHPERARRAAQSAGLVLERAVPLDMGGFDAEIQRFLKPEADAKAPRVPGRATPGSR
jgi:23S rRNA G2445 N2-methylase RlmL